MRDRRAAFAAPLEIATRDRIGQTSSAVALGGLRTLVATFLNLRAFTYFTEQRWDDVADTYDTIVDLAPHTRYYWETGSWHLAYNAASYYLNDSELPPLRRREAWRASILRGRAFLERGIRNNPDDWSLLANLGMLLSDPIQILRLQGFRRGVFRRGRGLPPRRGNRQGAALRPPCPSLLARAGARPGKGGPRAGPFALC